MFLVVVILGVSLGIIIGVSSLILRQIAMVIDLGESIVALHAADSGIEHFIYKSKDPGYQLCTAPCVPLGISNNFSLSGLSYQLYLAKNSPIIIRSLGRYRRTHRAIEVSF